ncbi:hypothetical protein BA724_00420 [Domibacillus iocasae]|uniref:MFS transporter n=1 Tax=Domibacillus iocasae TaxID=1714016 RepID=A0A1E7DTZ6_9BACI|nr:hypothetical protein BA724_00420 [Domibacillus iocasae]
MEWNYFFMLATVFIGFLIFGFSENVKGPAMPRIQADFELDAFQMGTLLSFNSLACAFIGICALFCALFSFFLYVYLHRQKEVI